MAAPRDISLDAVREFMIDRGGRVTNQELVRHFKHVLTDPYTKDYTRNQFKEYVNHLATIQQENGDKYLLLKSKFYPPGMVPLYSPTSDWDLGLPLAGPASLPLYSRQNIAPPPPSSAQRATPPAPEVPAFRAPPPYRPPPEPLHATMTRRSSFAGSDGSFSSTQSGPPSYHYPPPVQPSPPPPPPPPSSSSVPRFNRQFSVPCDDFIPASAYLKDPPPERAVSIQDLTSSTTRPPSMSSVSVQDLTDAPALPPRRKPQRQDDKENMTSSMGSLDKQDGTGSEEVKISVKERTQRFNRMASEVDLLSSQTPMAGKISASSFPSRSKNRNDDDDASSLATMEPHAKDWMLATARGDYHAIARLLRDEPRLARRRDFVTGYTGLHWAAKHGDDALVKMLAGTYKADVNARTNAGCTPLHLAAMQGHEDVMDLLVKTYGADSNMRDYSGKKPHQYSRRHDTSVSSDTFRKITAKRNMAEEKEAAAAGFLRIGSLNVRVKKTTEAFNNLLSSNSSSSGSKFEKFYSKQWGSNDNLSNSDGKKGKRIQPLISLPMNFQHTNQFTCPPVHEPSENKEDYETEDSDSAYGFGNGWQNP